MTRTSVALATALVAAAGAAVPAAALAGTSSKTVTYDVSVKPGKLAGGQTSVKAKAVVRSPRSSVKDWWSRSTVSYVVRKAANGGYEEPFNSQGYRCTPRVGDDKGTDVQTTRFTCRLQGADVPTSVRLTFTLPFAQASGDDD